MTFSLGSTPRSLVKYNDQSLSTITEVGSGSGVTDDMVLIKEVTASTSATLSFVDGASDVVLDSTYPIYLFKFISIHPATDEAIFSFQGNVAGGADYNETITSTVLYAAHNEANTEAELGYNTGLDQAQGTAFQGLTDIGNENDQCCSGELYLFNPSSTTFVTHFIATMVNSQPSDYAYPRYIAGYFNTASAIDEIQFKMSSGNMDSGTIKLYGLKDS